MAKLTYTGEEVQNLLDKIEAGDFDNAKTLEGHPASDFTFAEDFVSLSEAFATEQLNISNLLSYFTNGSANNALKLGDKEFSYFASVEALTTLSDTVNDFRALFDSLFEKDSANNAIKAKLSLYSLGGITAGGVGNGTSGGGSSYERLDDWAYYAPEKVLSALLGKQIYDRIGAIEGAGYITQSALTPYALTSTLANYQPLATAINTSNIGSQSVAYATKAAQDSDGNAINLAYYRDNKGEILTDTNLASLRSGSYWLSVNLGSENPAPITYSSLSVLGTSHFSTQLSVSHNASRAFLRGITRASTGISASAWHEVAFTDSNVASADYATSAGSANNANALGGQVPAYYATTSALTALTSEVSAFRALFDELFEKDSANNAIKAKLSLYSLGGITAGGMGNGTSGGGSSYDRLDSWNDYAPEKVLSALLGKQMYDRIGAIEGAGYAKQSWVTSQGYITQSALTPYFLTSNFTKENIKATLGIIDSVSFALVNAQGVMEIGKYVDFHTTDEEVGTDYSLRIECQGNYRNRVYFPTASGTIALTSDLANYQPLATAINTGNIGSQSVAYATSADTANSAISTSFLNIAQIASENDIVNQGVRGYSGSGSNWVGDVGSMAYAAILTFGRPDRGWQLWASRGEDSAGSFCFRVGNTAGTAWAGERILLDSKNYNSYALAKDGTAVDSNKLGGQVPAYYATASALTALTSEVTAFRALFDSLFEKDSANNAIKAKLSLYSLGGITAGGVGSGTSGGGSSYERLDDWAYYAPEKVLSALLGKQIYDRIGAIEGAGYITQSALTPYALTSTLANYQPLATAINTSNIGSQSVAYATKAAQDSDGNAINLAYYRDNKGEILTDTNLASLRSGSYWLSVNLGSENPAPITYSSLSVLGTSHFSTQLSVSHNASRAFLRGITRASTGISASAWHEVAFTDSNVASADYATSAGSANNANALGGQVPAYYATTSALTALTSEVSAFRALFDELFEKDSANNAIKAKLSLYSLGGITAGGVGNAQVVALEQRIANLESQIVSLTNQISA